MAGVSPNCSIAGLQGTVGQCRVNDQTGKTTAATHDEFAVPFLGQE